MLSTNKIASLLPSPNSSDDSSKESSCQARYNAATILTTLIFTGIMLTLTGHFRLQSNKTMTEQFFWTRNDPTSLCAGADGKGSSHSGYVGLKGDCKESPKRSFYWLFEAQKDVLNAPVILTIGGGPGTTGLLNPMVAQSHCSLTANGSTIPNPDAWSEHFNLLALDHVRFDSKFIFILSVLDLFALGRQPIGVGFSYGTMVNNSRSAAYDVYDFLQKFFLLYPHLAKSKFVVASGSYGGTYVPHIATVIHEQNKALALGEGQPEAIHINLDSLMVSNPYSVRDTSFHLSLWVTD
ncbi:hypothetical protein EW146_g10356 [Bondarzewia mesenterica]|uniref:Uncharacterized protein n=1 Tax=Bondarzewia mesenterica TaxID=1095465 RepID=A0A4S4KYG2_9AGAM|nr:hypothetical protein EW146_g10356 [Bondarzewia mesenterica]